MTLFSEKSKLRDEEIQNAIWENPNYEIEPNLVKVKKSKLGDGTKSCQKKTNPNCEMEWKMMGKNTQTSWVWKRS